MPNATYVPSRVGEGYFIDFTAPAAGATDRLKAWLWNDITEKFEPGLLDHGLALTGLDGDDHVQYALLAGRAGGQIGYGGNAANDDLTLSGTSHATKATSYLLLQPSGGNVGVGLSAPDAPFQVSHNTTSGFRVKVGDAGDDPMVQGDIFAEVYDMGSGIAHWVGNIATNYKNGQSGFAYLGIYTAGGTRANPLTLGNSQTQGQIAFRGYNNSAFRDVISFLVTTDSDFTASNKGKLTILTGSTVQIAMLSSGMLGVCGITAPTAGLHLPASTTARASACIPHGVAPTSPVNGDMWTTTAGLFVRINGVTKTVTLT